MIIDFFLLMWVLGVTVPIYWCLPVTWNGTRFAVLIAISALIIASLNPLILLGIVFYALVLLGFVMAFERGVTVKRLRPWTWFIFAPLALLDFIPPTLWVSGFMGQRAAEIPLLVGLTYTGLSYTAIRCFIMVREHFEKKGPTVLQAITAFLFFGHLVAGPISGAQPWRNIATRLSGENLVLALCRIFWGAALFFVIQEWVSSVDVAAIMNLPEDHRAVLWVQVYQNFLALYIDFAGYTEVAIGTALLFGVTLPENFRWPLRATSIQEFWQRWHLSLGRFINTYLFSAIVRELGKPSLAIFLSFIAVGLWHQLSLPYFLWGLGHGAALAGNMWLRKRYLSKPKPAAVTVGLKAVGWVFTMSYVALLSAIGNSEDLQMVAQLLGRLF